MITKRNHTRRYLPVGYAANVHSVEELERGPSRSKLTIKMLFLISNNNLPLGTICQVIMKPECRFRHDMDKYKPVYSSD